MGCQQNLIIGFSSSKETYLPEDPQVEKPVTLEQVAVMVEVDVVTVKDVLVVVPKARRKRLDVKSSGRE